MRALFALPAWATALMTVGCAPIASPVTVEALVHDPEVEGAARLGDVELNTVTDLERGEGDLFVVRGGLRMVALTIIQSIEAEDDHEEMVERCRGDGGNTFHPRMHWDGERWVADDLETLTAFTIFAALEASYARARAAGDEDGSARGALIGVTSEIVVADLLPIPLMSSDNAAYVPPLDAWLTLRVGLQQGVPFAMSLPVIAHEFGHRLFFRNVFRSEGAFDVWRTRADTDLRPALQRANRLLAGIDEGLADLFSLSVTGDLDGIPRAFRLAKTVFEGEADRRDLEGSFADSASYDGLNELSIDSAFLTACGASDTDAPLFEQETFNFYCLGTVLARALWDASARDIEVLREVTMPAVIRAMRALGERLADGAVFDLEVLLEPLVQQLPAERRAAACAAFSDKFESILQTGRVPSCP